jgi:anti-sigma factor RsiW
MSSDRSGDPALLRSYLLRQLGEDDADALETRLLKDDVLFELAEAVEGDLLAAFSRTELPPNERKQVIRRLAASPRGRARLALAEGLTSLAGPAGAEAPATLRPPLPFRRQMPRAERPAYRFAAIAAGVFVTAGGAWLAMQTAHLWGTGSSAARNEIVDAARNAATPPPRLVFPVTPGSAAPAPDRVAVKPPVEPPAHQPPLAAFVFQLAISNTRSAGQATAVMKIPAGTKRIEIELPLDEGLGDSFKTYSAAVTDAASETKIWSQERLTPRHGKEGQVIILSLPAAKLPEGRYTVDLRGLREDGELEPVGFPSFEVQLISAHR